MNALWQDFFSDPSQFWDNRNTKTDPRSPDFIHKVTHEFLWINRILSDAPERVRLASDNAEERELVAGGKKKKKALDQRKGKKEDAEEFEHACTSINQSQSQKDAHWPDTLVGVLQICTLKKDLSTGKRVHANISKTGLLHGDIFIGSSLINMYAKCGALPHAREVFDQLPVQDAISWTLLIAGYAQHGFGEEAIKCFDRMQSEGHYLDGATFTYVLKACGSIGALDKGMEVHTEVVKYGLLKANVVIGTALVNLYAKCDALADSQKVFDELPLRDAVAWNALIAGYALQEQAEMAMKCFEEMLLEGVHPTEFTFSCILKACGSIKDAHTGQEVYVEIIKKGLLEKNIIVGNALVDMYAKCGILTRAQEVFDMLPAWDKVSWNVLIGGYTQHEHAKEAINCFEQMQLEGLSPDAVTLTCILKAFGTIGATGKGLEVHSEIIRHCLFQKDPVLHIAVVDMYAKCGAVGKAQEVLDELPVQTVVAWNALITGYAQHGYGKEALDCFAQMHLMNLSPDVVTYINVLKACADLGALDKGQEIHAEVKKHGLMADDSIIGNALVDMYAKCGEVAKAQEVFDELPIRDAVTWTSLMTGYALHGHGEKAINCYEEMRSEGFSTDAVTFVCALKACSSVKTIEMGQLIHDDIVSKGLLSKDTIIGTALVDMYAKCGALGKAKEVFKELPFRNAVTWNALIAGFSQHGYGEESIDLLEQMQLDGFAPSSVTFVCIVNACGTIGALEKGQQIHAEIATQGLLAKEIIVGNSLVDMYGKCGEFAKAQEVFCELPARDVVSWNALISGYMLLGNDVITSNSFIDMLRGGEVPTAVTLVVLLNMCSHSGRLDRGFTYLETMCISYQIPPTSDHLISMLDLYCRAGHLGMTLAVIKSMPFLIDPMVWRTLLGGCQKWGNVDLGRLAFEQAVQCGDEDAATYISMSNILASCNAGHS